MDPVAWHKVRNVIMLVAMRAVSLETDRGQSDDLPGIFEYFGYMLGAATSLFGPWISFKDYAALHSTKNELVSQQYLSDSHEFDCHLIICRIFDGSWTADGPW